MASYVQVTNTTATAAGWHSTETNDTAIPANSTVRGYITGAAHIGLQLSETTGAVTHIRLEDVRGIAGLTDTTYSLSGISTGFRLIAVIDDQEVVKHTGTA